MDKTRLVNLATDLLIKVAYSDLEMNLEIRNYDGGELGVNLYHLDDRYKSDCELLSIYHWLDDEEIMARFEQMKEVIAGERLIENEWDT